MGQVVDISLRRRPQEITQLPNEAEEYIEDVCYRARFDQERVAHGLEPVAIEAQPEGFAAVVEDEFEDSEVDDGPPSIWLEKFKQIGLADIARDIIDANKADRESKTSSGQAQAQAQCNTNGADQTEIVTAQVEPQLESQKATQAPAQTTTNGPFPPYMQGQYDTTQSNNGAAPSASHSELASPLAQLVDPMSKLKIHDVPTSNAASVPEAEVIAQAKDETPAPAQAQAQPQAADNGYGRVVVDRGLAFSRWNNSGAETSDDSKAAQASQQVPKATNGLNGAASGAADNPATYAVRQFDARPRGPPGMGAPPGLPAPVRYTEGADSGAYHAAFAGPRGPANSFGVAPAPVEYAAGGNNGARCDAMNHAANEVRPRQADFAAPRGPANPLQAAVVAQRGPPAPFQGVQAPHRGPADPLRTDHTAGDSGRARAGVTNVKENLEPLPTGSDWM